MNSLELFAGIGGIALSEAWAGIETIAFCEREPFCQKVLNKHWPDVPIFDDVRTLNKQTLEERGIDVGTIELISGGFPCQPFSIAGKRKGKEDDRDLWPEMFRIIEEIRPTWVVGENVANFVNMELDRTIFNLESIGYSCQSFVIPACAVNAKHRRDRTFVVANSNGLKCLDREFKKHSICSGNQTQFGFTKNSTIMANSNIKGLEGWKETIQQEKRWKSNSRYIGKSISIDGRNNQWDIEPNVGRVANGIPDRVDRLRSLGNAVVPQQIYPIFKYIMEIERMNNQ